ncbi:hypothetical protein [Streptomyces murinus]|uniref:hypothetical protein n=1 Tax=Streptomyces murinus TaxID=33900 RepID=UPI002E119A48|nr:hypothetical protein OG516_28800 [Streptomyces murinus]
MLQRPAGILLAFAGEGFSGRGPRPQSPAAGPQQSAALSFDEYGNPECGAAATRYGWLGGEQRSSDTVTGAILYRRRYCVGIWVAYAHPKTPNIYRYKHGFCR